MIARVLRHLGYVPHRCITEAVAAREDALHAAWAVIAEERAHRRDAELLAAEWERFAGELGRHMHGRSR